MSHFFTMVVTQNIGWSILARTHTHTPPNRIPIQVWTASFFLLTGLLKSLSFWKCNQ